MRYLLFFAFLFSSISSNAVQAPPNLTQKELDEVNEISKYYVSESTLTPLAKLLYGAYLANAQRDFAWQSQKEYGAFKGSFIPVTVGIWELFQPNTLLVELENKPVDSRSQEIAEGIVATYKNRLHDEGSKIKNSQILQGSNLWAPQNQEIVGLNFASIRPWSLKTCSEFRCLPPSGVEAVYQAEILNIKKQMANLDIKKLSAIDFWANQADWIKMADKQMSKDNVPLETRLDVRAALFSAVLDTTGASFDSKFTYYMPRPSFYDKSIFPVVAEPSYPSYPSNSSAVSRAIAVIMGGYFPASQSKWDTQAQQAGLSKISAGLHFVMDHEAGKKLGEQVGKATLKNYKKP